MINITQAKIIIKITLFLKRIKIQLKVTIFKINSVMLFGASEITVTLGPKPHLGCSVAKVVLS